MDNKLEIMNEYHCAWNELIQLQKKESILRKQQQPSDVTVVVYPQFGDQMMRLNKKCDYLGTILEAMDASED